MTATIEAIIIGNEIISGRRQDTHLQTTIAACETRGLRLSAVHYLGDEPTQLIRAYEQTLRNNSIVFSFGGIGATPDDRTRQAAAKAMGVALEKHPQGLTLLQQKFGQTLNAQREQLITFPTGSTLIPNPVNGIPGFSLREHHFVPGFPSMATPMIAWVLDHYYAHLAQDRQYVCFVAHAPESQLIPLLNDMENRFASVNISCLPQSNPSERYSAELGFEGNEQAVNDAFAYARRWLIAHGVTVS